MRIKKKYITGSNDDFLQYLCDNLISVKKHSFFYGNMYFRFLILQFKGDNVRMSEESLSYFFKNVYKYTYVQNSKLSESGWKPVYRDIEIVKNNNNNLAKITGSENHITHNINVFFTQQSLSLQSQNDFSDDLEYIISNKKMKDSFEEFHFDTPDTPDTPDTQNITPIVAKNKNKKWVAIAICAYLLYKYFNKK